MSAAASMPEPFSSDEDEDEDEVALAILAIGDDNDDDDDDDDDDEEEEEEEVRVSHDNNIRPSNSGGIINVEEEEEVGRSKRRRIEEAGGEIDNAAAAARVGGGESSQGNRSEIEGLFCPICMDSWTSEGDHHICCLPCGHLFGLSCIKKWLQQNQSKAKCPQCNRKCTLKDIRKLFAPRLAVVDEESQKTIRSLEVKCAALEKKEADWYRKESEWQKRRAGLELRINQLTQRETYLEHLLGDLRSRSTLSVTAGRSFGEHGNFFSENVNSEFSSQISSGSFVLESELHLDGVRLFDIDVPGQIILLARRMPKFGPHVLTKMNLLPPHEIEDIFLPSIMKMTKDLHISPFNGSHALCASLGKKVSVLSTESNSVVLSCDLPAPAWSCSWDLNSSHYIYAGLQNGSLLAFDIRQTGREVESRLGLTKNPIHTLHSLKDKSPSGVRKLLSVSSIGICQWNFDCAEERPLLIPETANRGVCISLAYCPGSDDIVATYRPGIEISSELTVSQPLLTPSPVLGQVVTGCHQHLKRIGGRYQESASASATVRSVGMPKSVIIDMENEKLLFAAGDEATCGLILRELPSFRYAQRLGSYEQFIYDMKYKRTLNCSLLGCLSDGTLQLFSRKLS